jgi:ferrous iron transport protein A
MKLSKLKIGQKAIVRSISSKEISSKLVGLGIVEGQGICYMYKAPFGGPIAFMVGAYVLALRPIEASVVEVDILD